METLAEFLKNDENQTAALGRIVGLMRDRGEWGGHGLFAQVAEKIGVSPAYVGRALTGKNRLTEGFIKKLAVHFGWSAEFFEGYVRGDITLMSEDDQVALDAAFAKQDMAISAFQGSMNDVTEWMRKMLLSKGLDANEVESAILEYQELMTKKKPGT